MPQSAMVRRDAVDELAHGGFALGRMLLAVKIFRHDDFRGEHRPRLRHLDVFLFENHLVRVVGDFGGALVPFDLVERLDFGVAEHAFDAQRLFGFGFGGFHRAGGGNFVGSTAGGFRGRRRDILTGINHGDLRVNFNDLIRPVSSETEPAGLQKSSIFKKNGLFLKIEAPH